MTIVLCGIVCIFSIVMVFHEFTGSQGSSK